MKVGNLSLLLFCKYPFTGMRVRTENLGMQNADDEFLHLLVDFVADPSKLLQDFFVGAGEGVGIVETDVEALADVAAEDGAGLFGVAANGDDEVPGFGGELFYGFGISGAEVDSNFSHDDLGERMDFLGGIDASGTDGPLRREGLEPPFSHLAAASVAGAENKYFHGIIF